MISSNEIELPFQKVPLFTSKLVLAVSKKHSLSALDKISFKKIEHLPLILPVKGFNSREFLDELFLKNNMKPKVSIELNAVHALLRLVDDSDYWATIVTEKALQGWNNIKAINITGVTTQRDSFMLTIEGAYQKKAVKLFMEEFRKSM